MWWNILRGFVAGLIVVGVLDVSCRSPRLGGLLLTLPLVSILAFVMAWTKDRNLEAVSRLARETLILVPLGLPFFVPLALADKLGLGFWPAFALGILFACVTIGTWMVYAPARI